MAKIVTDGDGVRYRTTDYPIEATKDDDILFDTTVDWRGEAIKNEVAQSLPRIPNWPLPGQAPQYLTDDPGTELQKGDIIAFVDDDFAMVGVKKCDHKPPRCTLGGEAGLCMLYVNVSDHASYGGHPERCYLIARADPEADA